MSMYELITHWRTYKVMDHRGRIFLKGVVEEDNTVRLA